MQQIHENPSQTTTTDEDASFLTAQGYTDSTSVQSDLSIGKSDIILVRPLPQQPPPYQSLPHDQNAVQRQQVPQYSTYPMYAQNPPYRPPPTTPSDSGRNFNYYDDSDDENTLNTFPTNRIRNQFVRKVYTILTIQLLFTFGFIFLCIFNDDVGHFVRTSPLYIVAIVTYFITFLLLICVESLRRTVPLNFCILMLFTLAMTYILGSISSFYRTQIVLHSIGITAGVCFLLSVIACQMKYDVTTCGFALCIASVIILIYGIVAMILSMFIYLPIVHLVYSCLIGLLFSMYLIYDTQQIMGGRRYELSAEEYIFGAITLYVDIVQIFLSILHITSYASR